ncbi:MAG: GPR endopeptidase [Lachnospiraceae bacterium]|nr:GPR endopeptidase [Lachnospiraceae bacterium]
MSWFQVRTDLALEARESIDGKENDIHGIKVEESYDEKSDVHITKVIIETKNGAKAMGKPMGTYVTLEAPGMIDLEEDYHQEISDILAREIRNLLPEPEEEKSILVVGLGNRDVTADSLGPNVVDNLFINRHIVMEYGKRAYNCSKMHLVSSLVPGVMAKTGMESAEIIRGVIEQTGPDMVIVIDALAARSTKRLNRTIQITNTGIHPGSGVGNYRNALNEESLHVPVMAIGVPTVVDAATIVGDAVGEYAMGEYPNALSELNNMYVTSKDVDAQVQQIGHILCDALNKALDISLA